MITLIKHLNNILTKGELILHIEPSPTTIKAIHKVEYTLYIFCKNIDRPYKLWHTTRSIKAGSSISDLDDEITEELLKFIMEGNLSCYE